MSDLICGKAAVGGNYNSTRDTYALDPTYVPARYNMEQYAQMYPTGKCAFTEEDCPVKNDQQFELVYDEHHVGHLVRK